MPGQLFLSQCEHVRQTTLSPVRAVCTQRETTGRVIFVIVVDPKVGYWCRVGSLALLWPFGLSGEQCSEFLLGCECPLCPVLLSLRSASSSATPSCCFFWHNITAPFGLFDDYEEAAREDPTLEAISSAWTPQAFAQVALQGVALDDVRDAYLQIPSLPKVSLRRVSAVGQSVATISRRLPVCRVHCRQLLLG